MQKLYLVDARDGVVGGEAAVNLYCRTLEGEAFDLCVTGTPCSLHVGISGPVDGTLQGRLEWLLSQKPQCRAFKCDEHGGGGHYGISREPCCEELVVGGRSVLSWEYSAPMRPFDVYREAPMRFLKVELARPWDISRAANWLSKNVPCLDPMKQGVFDKLSFGYEYLMRETGLSGFEWFEVPVGSKVVDWSQVKRMNPQPIETPPMRKFTFDIEVLGKTYNNVGTKAADYPVCVISAESRERMVSFVLEADQPLTGLGLQEEKETENSDPFEDELLSVGELEARRAKMVKKELKIEEKRLEWQTQNRARREERRFRDEAELLWEFSEFLRAEEPDILVGFNHRNYDIPYLLRRAEKLGVDGFSLWCRGGVEVLIQPKTRERQGRVVEGMAIDIPGVVVLDMMLVAESSLRLDSYSLKSVLLELDLGCKGDVRYDQIWPYHYGSEETRAALVEYCERDTGATSLIEVAFDQVEKLQAKCRVQRCLGRDTTDRGLSYTMSQFLRSRLIGRFVLPVRPFEMRMVPVENVDVDEDDGPADEVLKKVFLMSPGQKAIEGFSQIHNLVVEEGKKYPGAFVLDPVIGLHQDAIGTIDAASLYPNSAISNNVCPSTLYSGGPLPNAPDGTTEYLFHFKTAEQRKGVLPEAWEFLVGVRNAVRKEQKGVSKGSVRYRQLEALQLEYKICANSLYGLIGAKTSPICSFPVASSITALGRRYLKAVEKAVTARFPVKIVYGDTDSLFIKFLGVREAIVAFRLGRAIQAFVNDRETGLLTGTMNFEFENVSMPTLLLAKKKGAKVLREEDGTISKVKYTGLDIRSLNPYANKTMKCVLSMGLEQESSQEKIVGYIKRRGVRLLGGKAVLADLRHGTQLTRPPEEYKSMLPHVVAAKQDIYAGFDVKPGDRIQFYYANVSVSNSDKKKKSPFVVSERLFFRDGHTANVGMYAESLVKSLKVTCIEFIKGHPEGMEGLIMNHPRVSFRLMVPPKTSHAEGGLSEWVSKGDSAVAVPKRVKEPEMTGKRQVQMGLFGQPVVLVAKKGAEKKQTKQVK